MIPDRLLEMVVWRRGVLIIAVLLLGLTSALAQVLAKRITSFDPDKSWEKVSVESPVQ